MTYIDSGVIYPQIRNTPVYSFLLVTGYLKAVKSDSFFGSDYICEVALPNREISFVYNKEILQKLQFRRLKTDAMPGVLIELKAAKKFPLPISERLIVISLKSWPPALN